MSKTRNRTTPIQKRIEIALTKLRRNRQRFDIQPIAFCVDQNPTNNYGHEEIGLAEFLEEQGVLIRVREKRLSKKMFHFHYVLYRIRPNFDITKLREEVLKA
jgi:hypothetical protein